jgi:hypothetical protein
MRGIRKMMQAALRIADVLTPTMASMTGNLKLRVATTSRAVPSAWDSTSNGNSKDLPPILPRSGVPCEYSAIRARVSKIHVIPSPARDSDCRRFRNDRDRIGKTGDTDRASPALSQFFNEFGGGRGALEHLPVLYRPHIPHVEEKKRRNQNLRAHSHHSGSQKRKKRGRGQINLPAGNVVRFVHQD